MCFSATASFTSWAILIVAWVFTLKQVKSKSSLAFASIPLLFGIQQFIEGLVWLSFWSLIFHLTVTYAFVFVAYVFWPIYVPISIWLIEKDPERKKMLWLISAIWALVGIYLFVRILIWPVVSTIISNSICYQVPVIFPLPSFILYLVATCWWSIISSSKKIRVFWTATLFSFFIAHIFYPETLFSVWCFFSAALSLLIYIHMKDLKAIIKN
jgi:hypothetical protein